MGLDSVELVLSFEETFQISIPNQEAEKMCTPRNVINFIVATLGTKVEGPAVVTPKKHASLCTELVCAMQASGIADKTVTMDLRLDAVFADRRLRRHHWRELRQQLHAKEWPHLRWLGLSADFPVRLQTLGDLVDWLACNRRQILTAEERQALTREDIAMIVRNITLYQTGFTEEEYSEDKRFVQDMGLE
ncbi:hypothetical protein [Prosthecobacter sp.]|uniref:hypothetical protein n=1 Tax=Prosthecobacter sp. TaxID=1965333 RepID=UPI0024873C18|nr:hypothetical protein [Prosthecobacter sp.]MDI1315008.1 hypothetical protein [Prosthecobacter sp.]